MRKSFVVEKRVLLAICAGVLGPSSGCTGGGPVQDPNTKIIVQLVGQTAGWQDAGIWGQVSSPLYPIQIQTTLQSIPYTAVLTGNPAGGNPYPTGFLVFKFFGAGGPFPNPGSFDQWVNYSASGTFSWSTDAEFPFKLTSRPTGNYPAGYDGAFAERKDFLWVKVNLFYPSPGLFDYALGKGDLLWTFDNANVGGGSPTVFQNESVWIQAAALQLPTPITYSWYVNGVQQSWTGSFIFASFPTNGNKEITAIMTGANSAQAEASWNVYVKCSPPYDPYADECYIPPEE
jgi:hypothetical protein